MNTRALSLAVAMSVVAPFTFANEDMSAVDTDQSGDISQNEFNTAFSAGDDFSEWDVNDDGLIDEDEYADVDLENDFADWDADSDNQIDTDEFYTGTFDEFDYNDDGIWDANEYDDAGDAGWLDV